MHSMYKRKVTFQIECFKENNVESMLVNGIFEPMFIYCVLRSARIFSINGFGIYRSLASCVVMTMIIIRLRIELGLSLK